MELILYAKWKGYVKNGGILNVSKFVYSSIFGDEQKKQPACIGNRERREQKKEWTGDGRKEMRKIKEILMSYHRRNTAVHAC
jgi:hypothetical protein